MEKRSVGTRRRDERASECSGSGSASDAAGQCVTGLRIYSRWSDVIVPRSLRGAPLKVRVERDNLKRYSRERSVKAATHSQKPRVLAAASPPAELSARGTMSTAPLLDSSLVDPASSHMLVSKIKPCMSQCKPYAFARLGETAKGSLNQLWFLRSYQSVTWITVVILELIHADRVPTAPVREERFY